MKIVIAGIIFVVIAIALIIMIEPFSYIQNPPADGINEIDIEEQEKDCSKSIDFMKQSINQEYYQYPRFLNPRESCQQECHSGIWFDDHRVISKKCCVKACENVKKGDFE